MTYRISIGFGKSGRIKDAYRPSEYPYRKYGFNWWFWLPDFRRNDGRFKLKSQCIEFDVNWLCFNVAIYFWRKPNVSKTDEN